MFQQNLPSSIKIDIGSIQKISSRPSRRSVIYGKCCNFLIIFLVALVVSTAIILSIVLTKMKTTTSITTTTIGLTSVSINYQTNLTTTSSNNITGYISYPIPTSIPTLINNFKGPNLSGGEFNSGIGKRYGYDYIYPSTREIDYYVSEGFGIIRMPFDMTRAYPVPYSLLNMTEMNYMKTVVDYCLSKGMHVILDPHNYGVIYDSRTGVQRLIGVDVEGTNLFADFWARMGALYMNYPNVLFGLMNEPNTQSAVQWYTGAIPSIQAIRAVGATQLILIPGTSWTGAHSWVSSGNAAAWNGFNGDPMNNFVFEMHQYLDSDSSGTHPTCGTNCFTSLQAATAWLATNGFKGFLGEFAWSNDSSCTNEGPAFLDYLSNYSNVWMGWTWWCGGPWYPSTYMFMLDPISFTAPIINRPQMALLLQHL
ncbi:unnamed protein product [Adineta steineri]|uniref:Glycoside hydrolase family 5 domain-containing protein n=1 Tax=Adineta steineri TaxID=433720 RepID=A0A819TH59_9BILA|nr:unnamed protein product [Adineta steineri]CAF1369394.1 unnamed protein product [Adineta steineri]CAF1502154.1 unnamed protein product [Adineta steineri]CAF3665601.1 unnamed protein product [Adineta steineri]CAF4073109.1 unnamed protein product [Adineta steineri]